MQDYVEHIILNYNDFNIAFFNINIKIENTHTESLHRHDYYEVHYSNSEYFSYEFSDKTITLAPKQFLIIPPQTLHKTIQTEKTVPTVVSFLITNNGNPKNYKRVDKALETISLKSLDIPSISKEQLMLLGNSQLYKTFLGNCKLRVVASDFIYKIFNLALDKNDFDVDENADKMILIDNLINYSNVSVKDIARFTNYSERQISRLIKKHYGMTLSEIKKKNRETHNER